MHHDELGAPLQLPVAVELQLFWPIFFKAFPECKIIPFDDLLKAEWLNLIILARLHLLTLLVLLFLSIRHLLNKLFQNVRLLTQLLQRLSVLSLLLGLWQASWLQWLLEEYSRRFLVVSEAALPLRRWCRLIVAVLVGRRVVDGLVALHVGVDQILVFLDGFAAGDQDCVVNDIAVDVKWLRFVARH